METEKWDGQRWWYGIAHVCRRWRQLVLTSASHLGLCLVCTYGTPVADVLAHSPPFPIIIDYGDEDREVTEQDEEGILLALRRPRRLRHIRLWMPTSNLRKLVAVMNGEFPMLEYLYINPLTSDDIGLSLPATFKGPLLRHFSLRNVTYSLSKLHPPLSTPRVQSTERIGLCSGCSGPRLWRYVLLFLLCFIIV